MLNKIKKNKNNKIKEEYCKRIIQGQTLLQEKEDSLC